MHHEFLGSEGFQGTHIDALNQFSSKFVNLFGKFSPLCGGPEMQILAKKSEILLLDYSFIHKCGENLFYILIMEEISCSDI